MQIVYYLLLLQLAGVDLCLFSISNAVLIVSLVLRVPYFVILCGPRLLSGQSLGDIFGLHVLLIQDMWIIVYL